MCFFKRRIRIIEDATSQRFGPQTYTTYDESGRPIARGNFDVAEKAAIKRGRGRRTITVEFKDKDSHA